MRVDDREKILGGSPTASRNSATRNERLLRPVMALNHNFRQHYYDFLCIQMLGLLGTELPACSNVNS